MTKTKKQETDYSDFYNIDINQDDFYGKREEAKLKKEKKVKKEKEPKQKKDTKERKINKRFILRILAFIFFIAFAFIVFLVIHKTNIIEEIKKDPPRIELLTPNLTLKVGETAYISYEIINTDDVIPITFTSSNKDVIIVNNDGVVEGIGKGEASVTLSYRVRLKKYNKVCNVVVEEKENSVTPTPTPTPTPKPTPTPTPKPSTNTKTPPTLNLSFASGKENTWTNKDVVIKVNAKSNTNSKLSLKYVVNCNTNCTYKDVNNNTITISNSGGSVVTVVATDSYNNKTTKSVTVKIDKTKPKIVLSPNNATITATNSATVCAICFDSESKCKQDKVCKTYTETASNQKLTVYDYAGNSATSNAFNVVIVK